MFRLSGPWLLSIPGIFQTATVRGILYGITGKTPEAEAPPELWSRNAADRASTWLSEPQSLRFLRHKRVLVLMLVTDAAEIDQSADQLRPRCRHKGGGEQRHNVSSPPAELEIGFLKPVGSEHIFN